MSVLGALKVAEPSAQYLFGKPAGDLLDVNVWLALAYDQHPHHASALAFWNQTQTDPNSRLWFCRVTMLGLVRLLCQPAVMQGDVLNLQRAWQIYQSFLKLPFVSMLSEPADVDNSIATFINPRLSSKHLTDVYLFSLAQCARLRLVSFDVGFEQYAGGNGLKFLKLN
jgi:uncharacterized protein